MFKFHELERSVCLTCQHFKGKRKVEVIGRKLFIDHDKNAGNCRIFNDFPVIITTRAGHCDWCHYKRWNQLPDIEKPEPPKPEPQAKKAAPARKQTASAWTPRPASFAAKGSADKSEMSDDEAEYAPLPPPRRRRGCLGRLVRLAIMAAILWWLDQKYDLLRQCKDILERYLPH